MRCIGSFLLFVLFSSVLLAQTNVDRIVEDLDMLSKGSYNNWKYSTDFSIDPTKQGFDDSGWKNLKLNESIFPDSCWLRKEIILPDNILGQPVSGLIKFLVTVDDAGYLYVNGEYKGYFPWDGEFELAKDAKPGQKFLIVLKAINTGGPLRLIRAKIVSIASKDIAQSIQDFALSLKVGQKLLSFDTYQTNARVNVDPGIDKSTIDKSEKKRLNDLLQSTALKINIDALKKGNISGFKSSLDAARVELKPVAEFAKRFTLFFDANAHIDAAWLWRKAETIEVCKRTFSSVMNMMYVRPDFTYTQSSAAYYDWMEKLYPDLFKQIKQRIKDGRWEVIGGMWIEPDCNIPSGESWMRQLLYAKKYFKEKFGYDVKIGWNPDSFGYNWNMPQFYQSAGIDAFITQKIGWNDTNVFPYRLFWWEGPDGSRILSYFPFDYVNTVENPFQLVDWLRQYEANTGFTKIMVLFGVGDHGGGPSLDMLQRIDRLEKLDIFPKIEYGTSTQYIDWLKTHDLSKIPVWNDELYLEYHQGTFTTQAKMKEFNRKEEMQLTNAEKLSSIASLFGAKYNQSDLAEAWKKLMFNQFHDILPGSSIHEVYVDATEDHKEVQTIGKHVLTNSLNQIASQINTTSIKKGKPIVVYNPLSWKRTDVVKLALPDADANEYIVFDADGKEISSQIIQKDKYNREIIFIAENIPSLGYKTYELRTVQSEISPRRVFDRNHNYQNSNLSIDKSSLENNFFKITIDEKSGWLKSIFDKKNNREILSGAGNELQILEDKPSAWDAWNIGLTGKQFPSIFRKAEFVESGPVRIELRLYRDYLKPGTKKEFPTEDFPTSFFTQDIILYKGIDRIDFNTDVDWWEEKTMLKVAFPLAVSDTIATYEIPYGHITRSTQLRDNWEKAKVEVPAQRWADVSSKDYGVSLLNNSKYGYDIKGNVMRLSLLRSPKWPDPLADRGKHSIEYSLYPHTRNWKDAQTVHRGYEFNNPLIAIIPDRHAEHSLSNEVGRTKSKHLQHVETKPLPPLEQSFVSLSPSNLILTSIKKAEDDDAWIIQWYDSKGEDKKAELTLPIIPKKVFMTNAMEENGNVIPFDKNKVEVMTKMNAVVTVKVYF